MKEFEIFPSQEDVRKYYILSSPKLANDEIFKKMFPTIYEIKYKEYKIEKFESTGDHKVQTYQTK
jgi:hypothetical protein